ncbi:MAG: ATP-binding protein [Candidatus Helarchaeota archaeon]
MEDNRYENLIKKLDSFPIGVKKPDSEIPQSFIELVKLIFTPEEAEIVSKLEFVLESAQKISKRLNRTREETEEILNNLADKGLIFRLSKRGKVKFSLFNPANLFDYPFLRKESSENMIKMAEFAMNWFETEFIDEAFGGKETGIYRVLPVEEQIKGGSEILSYEIASGLLDSMSNLTLIPCVCRRRMELIGNKKCDHPVDGSCITFGSTGLFFQERGYGRPISKNDAKELIRKYQEDGLILMTTNSQEKILVICACCECCCVGLRGLLEFKKPAAVMKAHFQIELDKSKCIGCGNCVSRCVFNANELLYDENLKRSYSIVNLDRCLGCGLCTITCEGNARKLVRVEDSKEIPKNFFELGLKIAEEKGKN